MNKVQYILSSWVTTVVLGVTLTLLLLAVGGGLANATLQTEKTIETLPYGNEPVDLQEIKYKGESIKAGEKIRADSEWLRDVSLQLTNKSGKLIVYVDVAFDFPETKSTGAVTSYSLRLGNRPGGPYSGRTPLEFKPGESLKVSLAEEYDKLKHFVEKSHPIASLNRVRVRVNFIGFDDGTAWSAGSFVRLDPSNPHHYIKINNQ